MLLGDYSSLHRCFELDPTTGAYSHLTLEAPRTSRGECSGMAQLLRSPREGKVLVAQYLEAGVAWLSIGAERWKLFDESISVKHKESWGIFLCELSLHQGGTCIRKFRYFRQDWFLALLDPAYDQLDFSLANLPVDFEPHGLTSLEKQREDFLKMWSGAPAP